ncbi:MAG TPA: hypothetical protein ENG01_00975 [Candidatus Aenigmarchaeota archaeon]
MLFGKKEETGAVPVNMIIQLRQKGLSNEDIIRYLKSKGYSIESIRDAIAQADIKQQSVGAPASIPTPPPVPGATPDIEDEKIEKIERILEQIIDEKWKGVETRIREIEVMKSKVEARITVVEQKIRDIEARLDSFDKALMSRMEEYSQTMQDVNAEVKALEKVMGKLVPAMNENISELRDIVKKLKR